MKVKSILLILLVLAVATLAAPKKRQKRQIGICLQQCGSDSDCRFGRCVFNGCGRICQPSRPNNSQGGFRGNGNYRNQYQARPSFQQY